MGVGLGLGSERRSLQLFWWLGGYPSASPSAAKGQAAEHTYAFAVVVVVVVVVVGLGTQAGWGLGRRLEKPGGGLLTGGARPGGGGGGVLFRSTTVLKPARWHKTPGHGPCW